MRRVRLTEGQLHKIIRNAVNEAVNGGSYFNPDEDMTEYRDQYDRYSPDINKRGPYENENSNEGDDDEMNGAIGFCSRMANNQTYNRLKTKRGQMNHDWDEINDKEDPYRFDDARYKANMAYQDRGANLKDNLKGRYDYIYKRCPFQND
jgi:hypothetical protein